MAHKDLKEGLSSARKADTTHVRSNFKRYTARACEYGDDKYERANYLRPVNEDSVRANFVRFRGYLRAAQDHIGATLDEMEAHQSQDPELLDEAGMLAAAFAADTDQSRPDFPASGLPHVAPACASLMMAIEQAVRYGILPADPGQPWKAPTNWRCSGCDGFTSSPDGPPEACKHCGLGADEE